MESFEKENSSEVSEEEIKSLFDQLNPRDQLLRLMLLVNIPRDLRPSEDLTIAEREEEIINWAKKENRLRQLADTLNYLIQRQ